MSAIKSSILNPSFSYIPANKTDIRKTFAKERKRLKEERKLRPVLPVIDEWKRG